MNIKNCAYAMASALILASCSGNSGSSSGYKIQTREERCLPIASLLPDGSGNYKEVLNTGMTVYHFNSSTVPYVDVVKLINNDFNAKGEGFPTLTAKGTGSSTVTVTNQANGSTLTIDFTNGKLTYSDFGKYYTSGAADFGGLITAKQQYFLSVSDYSLFSDNKAYVIDLDDYGFRYYCDDTGYYLPFGVAGMLVYTAGGLTSMFNYLGDTFFFGSFPANPNGLAMAAHYRDRVLKWIDKDYLTYDYNLMALELDHFFGLDKRPSRANKGKTIDFARKGYDILAPYKDRILSTEPNDRTIAFAEIYSKELDDGGHSALNGIDVFASRLPTAKEAYGPEWLNYYSVSQGISDAKKAAGLSPAQVTGVEGAKAYYKEYGDIAYVCFDSFEGPTAAWTADQINETNYFQNTIALTTYAAQKVKTDGIKDLVIDLSTNGGGLIDACDFMASWLEGGSKGAYRNTKTGAYAEYTLHGDTNFDGVLNEDDYLDPNVNLYFIVSDASFSCGNKLPTQAKASGRANTYFIGSRSGGGSCIVYPGSSSHLGLPFRLSSSRQIAGIGSTREKFVSNEEGVAADFYQIDDSNYAAFADHATINEKIKANRKS